MNESVGSRLPETPVRRERLAGEGNRLQKLFCSCRHRHSGKDERKAMHSRERRAHIDRKISDPGERAFIFWTPLGHHLRLNPIPVLAKAQVGTRIRKIPHRELGFLKLHGGWGGGKVNEWEPY